MSKSVYREKFIPAKIDGCLQKKRKKIENKLENLKKNEQSNIGKKFSKYISFLNIVPFT